MYMSIQPIRLFGDPVLISATAAVIDFDKEIRTLVADLMETMHDAPGAGLAAPQIGVPLRVFVWDINEELGHLINPTLDLSEELQDGEEGCLSFPALSYETPRAMRAVAKGWNMYGEPITVEGTELLARALQHETDHLDGIVFIDRLSAENRKMAMKEIRESDWFGLARELGGDPQIRMSPHNLFGRVL
jgi:peptide deformylase